MTPLPLETSLANTGVDTVSGLPSWAARYFPRNNAQMPISSNTSENILDNQFGGSVLEGLLPRWAKIIDDGVNCFLRSYCLEKELATCIQIIGSILKSRPKAKIRLVDDSEYDREYISISLVLNRKNVSNMADYIYNCNLAIARSLPSSKLQYFVITME